MTQRGRRFFRFKARVPSVTNHHAIDYLLRIAAGKGAKDGELFLIQLFAGAINFWQTVVSIHHGGGIAGKMFPAAGDGGGTERVIEGAGISDHLLNTFSVAAPA